jgi:hypothetical protein
MTLRFFFVLLLAVAPIFGIAQPTEPLNPAPGTDEHAQQERARIAAYRKTIEEAFATEQAQCYKKFAVNDCLQESRVRRRDALADLRRQEVSLNDAQRKKKGAEQVRKVEEKVSAESTQRTQEQRQKAEDSQARRQLEAEDNAARRARMKEEEPAKRARQQRETQRHSEDAAARAKLAGEAPANARRYEDKLQDAAEYKADREKKNAKKTKPPAKPLPAPAS